MRNRLILVLTWFGTSLTAIIFSSALLLYLSTPQQIAQKPNQYRLYQALPTDQIQFSDVITHGDGRSLIVENFFKGKKSVLADFAGTFVSVADFYHLDYRLLPSIAMQESNGGKVLPDNSYNPFGYGIYGSNKIHFQGWDEAIKTVGKALREDYLNQGLHTPYQIMTKYTPPSVEKGGSWAIGVSQFMDELR